MASKLRLTLPDFSVVFAFSHIGPGHRGRVCITLEPAQLLKGDIMVGKQNKMTSQNFSTHCSNHHFFFFWFSYRLNVITRVTFLRSVKLFSGCSSTREQCRATTWCLKKRTWRLPTKVDLKKPREQVPTCCWFTATPLLLAAFCGAQSGFNLDLALWDQ